MHARTARRTQFWRQLADRASHIIHGLTVGVALPCLGLLLGLQLLAYDTPAPVWLASHALIMPLEIITELTWWCAIATLVLIAAGGLHWRRDATGASSSTDRTNDGARVGVPRSMDHRPARQRPGSQAPVGRYGVQVVAPPGRTPSRACEGDPVTAVNQLAPLHEAPVSVHPPYDQRHPIEREPDETASDWRDRVHDDQLTALFVTAALCACRLFGGLLVTVLK